ncbi:MAG: hydratase [Cupriavidus sp.]|jgi:N-carbamoylputrescine amidase|uniref:nitrilase family protein n=1 Tax=Burkholderiaceae TaxID=119060 RepID=UPI00018E362B|nr:MULTISPECIES: nitrilase family protein [Burkholderiaceae]ART89707.1 aliphatic amidase amiE [uncultured bacterium]MBU67887.1 hydratase [Cupriavidus sp.]EED97211.1 carbon-nitrogen hydrolase family protein [Burkholderia multivorans CGD1]MBU67907.1 hydratase [Cupriavidus sp.]MBY4673901.1 nitrilase family protein [Burkholderia multivorans]
MSTHEESGLKIACLQFSPLFGDVAGNLQRSIAMIEKAADAGARIVVLPELANTGYTFKSRAEAFELAEPVPDGRSTQAWAEVAACRNLIIVAGITEREDNCLYNSAVVLDPSGTLGTYRKLHLWGDENLYFERGNLGVPVFATPYGRIGVAICYDGWFPEVFRLAAVQGADLMCVPTNWVPIPGQQPDQPPMANILHMALAHSNSMVIACADRVGVERGQPFIGHSLIVGHTGWPVAGPASGSDEEILIGEVSLSAARRDRNWNSFNHPLHDRRTDFYAESLGVGLNPNLNKR